MTDPKVEVEVSLEQFRVLRSLMPDTRAERDAWRERMARGIQESIVAQGLETTYEACLAAVEAEFPEELL